MFAMVRRETTDNLGNQWQAGREISPRSILRWIIIEK